VISSIRLASRVICTVVATGGGALAQAAPAPPPPATVAALLASLPKWSATVSLETSYGYKDNLLLSYAGEEHSAFARGGVEAVLLRIPTGQFDYSLYLQADRTWFFTGRTMDHEAQAWLVTEPAYRCGEVLRISLPLTTYYTDRILDVSDSDVERLVAKLKETGGMAGPTLRWTISPTWWLEAQAVGQRRTYEDHAYNSNLGEGDLRLGWAPLERLELRLSGAERWRNFARRAQYSSAGRELPGTHLKAAEREAELRADVKWDEAAHWRTTTRLSGSWYRDNGPAGYFNYNERKSAQDLEWQGEAWSVRLTGLARRIDYLVQTVGFGIRPPARLRDEYSAEVHVERKLSKQWTIFGTYQWERSRSNDRFASYNANEGLLGVRWSWEK